MSRARNAPTDAAAASADEGALGSLRGWPLLRPGDRVALFSPAGPLGRNWRALLDDALGILCGWGLRVLPQPAEPRRHLYLAGDDRARAEEFQALYCDPDVKALFATRGGYGVTRMLPLLDAGRIAQAAPKAVVGFSDIAALFIYLHKIAGAAGLHAPCLAPSGGLISSRRVDNLAALHAVLFAGRYPEPYALARLPGNVAPAASVRGRLLGGTLTLIAASLGTPWELDTRGAILFREEVDETPYRVDRLVTHLRTAGKLDAVRAVVLGQFTRCDDGKPELLQAVLEDLLAGLPVPVLSGLPAGHGDLNLPLPLGRAARLDLAPDGAGRLSLE